MYLLEKVNAECMVDLQKLQERIDALFKTETYESFHEWLAEKEQQEFECLFMKRLSFSDLASQIDHIIPKSLSKQVTCFPAASGNLVTAPGNTQYAMAA